ncbi:MAG: HAMP domain-containing protein, partial [Acutalibacteraceae bacterium]|nr:HAMP domain-containing protein [Acutalibacteraceae bacterium]
MKKGITGRWLVNTFGVIFIVVVTLILILSLMLKNYYYNGIHQTLNGRVDELTNVFGNYKSTSYSEFDKSSRTYVENFADKDSMELMVINPQGIITITSTGFPPDREVKMEDYNEALNDTDGYGFWVGSQNDEKIMAVTRIITDATGERLGAVRYCVSLEPANRHIFVMIMLMIVIGFFILFFVMVSGAYFVRSIVNPISKINEVSKKIAEGDFEARLEKQNDDEIG